MVKINNWVQPYSEEYYKPNVCSLENVVSIKYLYEGPQNGGLTYGRGSVSSVESLSLSECDFKGDLAKLMESHRRPGSAEDSVVR